MGYNYTGLAVNEKFTDTNKLISLLNLPLEYVKDISMNEGLSIKDPGVFDVFYSDSGLLIYTAEPIEIDPSLSKDRTILNFMVNETSMVFYFGLDVDGVRMRELAGIEYDIQNIKGEALEIEQGMEDMIDLIEKQKSELFGMEFHQIPMDFEGKRFIVSADQASVNDSDEAETFDYKAPFYVSGSRASNPGKMNVNIFRWISMNVLSFFKNTLAVFIGFYLMLQVHWLFGLLFVGALLYNIWYWFGVINKFKAGDVNVGKVICINPVRVAVATDMTKMIGHYPVIKIIETHLPSYEKEVGMFIPTTALYNDNPFDYPFWAEFHPVPISLGVSNRAILKQKLEGFGHEDFERINRYLTQLDKHLAGTYKIDIQESNWKEYPNVEIGSLNKMKGPEKD